MKKFKVLLMCLCVCFLTGCSEDKVSITADDFVEMAKEYEFKVVDYTGQFAYSDTAYAVEQDDLYIFFLDGKKQYDVEGLFIDECTNIYKEAGTDYDKSTRGGDNWLRVIVTTDDKYYHLTWVNDTYIVVKARKENQSKVEKIMDGFGY